MKAQVMRTGLLDMQVCVPKEWTDEQVLNFAEKENPCGTVNGWFIRKQGSKYLSGDDERVQCHSYEENCHIILDA